MRNLNLIELHRVQSKFGGAGNPNGGAFIFASPEPGGGTLRVIASVGAGWDHVSVSRKDRIPTWTEMEFIRRYFFRDDEIAMQLHVPPALHINYHPHCLHMWRPHDIDIPLPPPELVGPVVKETGP